MRILVTGGAGFQGSHLVKLWAAAGHRVTVLNTYSDLANRVVADFHPSVNMVWGSVTDPEIVMKSVREQDVVVHLAARINVDESSIDPGAYVTVNVMGTLNVLEAVRKSGGRMIYGSSCEVYGSGQEALLTENSPLLPYSPYAASKAAADRLCFAYFRTYGLNVIIVRPCNIYGEGQRSGKGGAVTPIFVENALNNKPLIIFGDGSQFREYMNIDDLVVAYDLVLGQEELAGETVNFGTGESVTVKSIAELVAGRLGAIVVNGAARPGEVPGFKLDCSKAQIIGFSPRVRFVDGLERYINWRLNETPRSPKK